MGDGIEDVDDCDEGDEGLVLPSDVVDSESDEWEEDLLSVRLKVDEALLKSDLAGDVACGVDAFGDVANGMPGMLMSLRTTMREMCKRLRANLFET